MASILVLHGPNLNMLGGREPEIYGSMSLSEIDAVLQAKAAENKHNAECIQSNSESELIGIIQKAVGIHQFIIINAAALTHTSIGLRDALKASGIPFIEVHISNIYAREAFRQKSYLSDIAVGIVCGLGSSGYLYALEYALKRI